MYISLFLCLVEYMVDYILLIPYTLSTIYLECDNRKVILLFL
nr:ALPV-020 [Albatrosspox virus]